MRRLVVLSVSMLLGLPLAACATMSLNLAPERPDAPWTPATLPDGEIVADAAPPSGLPGPGNYVLPSNRRLAGALPAASELKRHSPYTLPELIDIAQTNNPATRNAWNDARDAALTAGIVESTFLPIVSAGIVQG